VEFGLLGPLVVRDGGSPVVVSAGKQRVLLAALLLRAGQVVPAADHDADERRPGLLPPAVPDFTGRAAELAALSAAPGQDGRPVVITAIGGAELTALRGT
jgi:hypothetical protein